MNTVPPEEINVAGGQTNHTERQNARVQCEESCERVVSVVGPA